MTAGDRAALTEAEYAASLPARMKAVADYLNKRLYGILPEDARFEWTAPEAGWHEFTGGGGEPDAGPDAEQS